MRTTTPPVVIVSKGRLVCDPYTVTRHNVKCGIARRTNDRNDAKAEHFGRVDERVWIMEGNYPVPQNHTCIPCPHYDQKEWPEFARRPYEDTGDCLECWAALFICPCCGLATYGMVMTTKCCLLCHPLSVGFVRYGDGRCPAHLAG